MDPREYGPQQRSANLSPLMQAQGRASKGEKVNFCPHGCEEDDLDDNGYCRHLVGFTLPGDEKHYEPVAADARGRLRVLGDQKCKVQPGDKLVKITVSSRVYRDVDAKAGGDKK